MSSEPSNFFHLVNSRPPLHLQTNALRLAHPIPHSEALLDAIRFATSYNSIIEDLILVEKCSFEASIYQAEYIHLPSVMHPTKRTFPIGMMKSRNNANFRIKQQHRFRDLPKRGTIRSLRLYAHARLISSPVAMAIYPYNY